MTDLEEQVKNPTAEEILDEVLNSAWRDYLSATKGRSGDVYLDVEAWAWARLLTTRRSVSARRAALKKKAGVVLATYADGTMKVGLEL